MFPILIVEDDENDIVLLRLALKQEGVKNPVHFARNGREAIDYLQKDGEFGDRTRFLFPSFVLTDLKMPGLGGFAVLEYVKKHPGLFMLPVVVLSSSTDQGDIEKAYRLGANGYRVKPGGLPELKKLLRTTLDFWVNCLIPPLNQ